MAGRTAADVVRAEPAGHANPGLIALAAAALLFGTLLVFQPAQVYSGNSAFFSLPFAQLSLVLLPLALCLSLLASLPARFGPAGWRRGWAALLSALAVMVWVSASFLYRGQGLLDGRALADATGTTGFDGATFLALAAGLAAAFAAWFSWSRLAAFFGVVVLLSLGLVALTIVRDDNPWQQAPDSHQVAQFSAKANVLVILLDTFQSDFIDEILQQEPALRDRLRGFTNYRNASGVAPTTYLSLPAIHSGRPYQPGTPLRGYYDRSVVEGSFVSRHVDGGFRAELLNPMMNKCPRGASCFSDEALMHGLVRGSLSSAALLIDLALLRSVPSVMRRQVFNEGLFVFGSLLDPESGHPRSNEVLRMLSANASVGGTPVLKFLHLFGSHPPARISADCTVGRPQAWTREAAIAQDRCALRLVADLIDRLAALKVLDVTNVVVLADTGAGLPLPPYSELQANAAPLLMIKPSGASGPLRDAHEPVSLMDIAASVCALSGACQWSDGRPVSQASAGPRDDPPVYNDYVWQHKYWYLESIPIERRYRILGSPWDMQGWRLVADDLPLQTQFNMGPGQDSRHFGPGWWSPERTADGRDFRWVQGRNAVIYMAAPKDWAGQLEITGFTHPGNAEQALEVFVDGQSVWQGAYAPTLKVSLAENKKPNAVFALGLRFAQDAAPGPSDNRRLSAAIERIVLR